MSDLQTIERFIVSALISNQREHLVDDFKSVCADCAYMFCIRKENVFAALFFYQSLLPELQSETLVTFQGCLSIAVLFDTKIRLYLILCLWWPLNSSLCGFSLLTEAEQWPVHILFFSPRLLYFPGISFFFYFLFPPAFVGCAPVWPPHNRLLY